jgi:acetyl-CoA synthetase
LNIVTNCVDKWAENEAMAGQTAVIYEAEEGDVKSLTYAELNRQVNQCANALRSLGLGKGDGIGLHMPMTPEIVVALLAIAKIGGVILPLFSGYGAGAIQSRLADGARSSSSSRRPTKQSPACPRWST